MERVSVGDIVFVRFPFSDLSRYKLRPALVLAIMERNDCILCQITSKNYDNVDAVLLQQDSFLSGGLIKTSFIRPSKLFTANTSIIEKNIAHITPDIRKQVVSEIFKLLESDN